MKNRLAVALLSVLLGISCGRSPEKPADNDPDGASKNGVDAKSLAAATNFFAKVTPGDIHKGRMYLPIPMTSERGNDRDALKKIEAFIRQAVPRMAQWDSDHTLDARKEGFGGQVIPEQYLDLKFIEATSPFRIGQTLKARTAGGVVPVRVTGHEIHFNSLSGRAYFYAIAEPVNGAFSSASQRVIVGPDLPDCSPTCALSRTKPSAEAAQRIRAVAIEQLDVKPLTSLPKEEQTETLIVYEGRFTRTQGRQYVAFFVRHAKETRAEGNWVTYVLDSDFSLIAVLGRDEYLQVVPDGVADVNNDGLDEIWSDDSGYEGIAYSLWYLKEQSPAAFGRIEWPYLGL